MSRRRLRFPLSLAFAVVSAGAPAMGVLACGANGPVCPDGAPVVDGGPVDAPDMDAPPTADVHSSLFCVPDGTPLDAGCPLYADDHGQCPPGCEPVS